MMLHRGGKKNIFKRRWSLRNNLLLVINLLKRETKRSLLNSQQRAATPHIYSVELLLNICSLA